MTAPILSAQKLKKLAVALQNAGINPRDIIVSAVLGHGKGGQKKNNTHNCIQLHHTPSNSRVYCQQTRSRELNKYYATWKLIEKISQYHGKPSAKTRAIQKKAKQKKRRNRRSNQGEKT